MRNFNKRKKCFVFLGVVFCMFLFTKSDVWGMGTDGLIYFYQRNKEYFVNNDFIWDALHSLGWMLVKGLKVFADACNTLYSYSLGFIDFTRYPGVDTWISTLKGVFIALLAVSIAYVGVTLIIDHKKQPQFLKAIVMAGLSISASGYLLVVLSDAVSAFCQEVAVGEVPTNAIINAQLYDLDYIDRRKGLSTFDAQNAAYLADCHYPEGSFNIDYIDINEVMNYEDYQGDTKDILAGKMEYVIQPDGTPAFEINEVYNGFGWNSSGDNDWFNQFYYRYKVNYLSIYLSLLSYSVVYLCISYKTCRIIYEIIVQRIMAILYSADIGGVQKTLKIWGSIKDSYIVLMLSAICIKIFLFAQLFLSNYAANNSFVYNLLSLFLAFAVVDGPVLIQQLTGIDAGLQTGVGRMVSAYQFAHGAASLAKAPISFARQQHQHHQLLNAMQGKNNGKDSEKNLRSGNSNTTSSGTSNSNTSVNNSQNMTRGKQNVNQSNQMSQNMNEQNKQNLSSAENQKQDINAAEENKQNLNSAENQKQDINAAEENKQNLNAAVDNNANANVNNNTPSAVDNSTKDMSSSKPVNNINSGKGEFGRNGEKLKGSSEGGTKGSGSVRSFSNSELKNKMSGMSKDVAKQNGSKGRPGEKERDLGTYNSRLMKDQSKIQQNANLGKNDIRSGANGSATNRSDARPLSAASKSPTIRSGGANYKVSSSHPNTSSNSTTEYTTEKVNEAASKVQRDFNLGEKK